MAEISCKTKRYPLDLTDEEWKRIQLLMPKPPRRGRKVGADDPGRDRFWERCRPVHLLTRKVRCGCCGEPLANVGRDYLACSAARKQGTCTNTRGIRREQLETLIVDALHTLELMGWTAPAERHRVP